jgi:hypothetical protein
VQQAFFLIHFIDVDTAIKLGQHLQQQASQDLLELASVIVGAPFAELNIEI